VDPWHYSILDKVSNQVYDGYNALTMRERLHVSTIRPPDDEGSSHFSAAYVKHRSSKPSKSAFICIHVHMQEIHSS
jgi:hypothetical protein